MKKTFLRGRRMKVVVAGALLAPLLIVVTGCWLFNVLPLAAFTISSQTGQVPFTVNFSGVLSEDEDGVIVKFEWDFGDGTSGVGENVSHTYTEAGSFTVVLRVTDDRGATATNSKTLYATPAEPPGPTAVFTLSPTSGTSPLTVHVNASDSTYDDGAISQYTWNWGDGATTTGVTASRTYYVTNATTYTVTLTVRGTDGKTGTATKTVTVNAAGTTGGGGTPAAGAPSARFTADPTQGVAPLQVTFDPSDTEVADGRALLSLVWSFGDATSATSLTLVNQVKTYITDLASKVFSVTLLAMDDQATTGQITKTLRVYNHAPVAGFEIANPAGGHQDPLVDPIEYATGGAVPLPRWDDDNQVTIGNLGTGTLAAGKVWVWIRSQEIPDGTWYTLDGTQPQDTLKMAKGILAVPGSTKPVPAGYSATNKAYSYDPEGQYWPLGEPAWFPNQAWGIRYIYVNWGDGLGEEQYDYPALCKNVADYDQDFMVGHQYDFVAAPGATARRDIIIRVVDFLGGQASITKTVILQGSKEGTDDL